jgi:hypothetical protein
MTKPTPSSDDAFKDSLNFVKKLWGGMGVPGMTASGVPTMPNMGMPMPTMSLEDMDKRIQELKSVETWLNMNLSMLRNTIQALEIQRATIATLHSLSSTMSQTMQGAENVSEKNGDDSAVTSEVTPLVTQSAAWWNAVQEQFKQALGAALEKSAAPVDTAKPTTENVKKPATKRTTKAKSASASKTRK